MHVLIPAKLQKCMLEELHQGHPSIIRIKSLVHSHVWLPTIDKMLEQTASNCTARRAALVRAPLHPWIWPAALWDHVHVDFAGQFLGRILLIVTDAYSKGPEMTIMTSTTAAKTIAVLREILRNSLPRQLVSDYGPQFVSAEFSRFLKENGVSIFEWHHTIQQTMVLQNASSKQLNVLFALKTREGNQWRNHWPLFSYTIGQIPMLRRVLPQALYSVIGCS